MSLFQNLQSGGFLTGDVWMESRNIIMEMIQAGITVQFFYGASSKVTGSLHMAYRADGFPVRACPGIGKRGTRKEMEGTQ